MMSQDEFINLRHINTSIASQNFVKLLEENKTYFLNGKWGSGKTEFLEEAKRYTKKEFVIVDFWKLNDSRTTIEIAFAKLHPNYYWGIRCLMVVLVAISILMTNVVNLGLSQIFPNWIVKFAGVLALFVAVYQFFKAKTDGFYSSLLTIKYVSLSNKILVIDVFDRLSEKQQEEAYKLFSLLKGRLPIVFVGDIELIHVVKENYLSKIIDRRVELPFDLHPVNIWDTYFQILEEKFNVNLSDDFKKCIKWENRNLRDREHFNDYVNQEFFTRGKLGYVQVEQQLIVIYVYLFHSKLYKELLEARTIKISAEERDGFKKGFVQGFIKVLLQNIQTTANQDYPICFAQDRAGYYLYESSSNRSGEELEKIFNGKGNELTNELCNSTNSSDFFQYLSSQYKSFDNERKNYLVSLAIHQSMKVPISSSMSYIIRERTNEIIQKYNQEHPDDEINNQQIASNWDEILNEENLELSEKIRFFQQYHILTFHHLGNRYSEIDITSEKFIEFRHKEFILLTYLNSKDLSHKFSEWNDAVWQAIDLLDTHQFLSFWIFQNIICSEKQMSGSIFDQFNYYPENKNYILWIQRYDPESYGELIDYKETVIRKIESRLETLKREGYIFEEKIDDTYKPKY